MLITSIYTLTIFTSAFLLFLIQPMISKLLLPHLGGSPAVWNTSMMFFQILLLLGYAYAHVSGKYLSARRQAWLHLLLLLGALAWLPIAAKTDLGFVSSLHPIGWVMLSLSLSVGVPFFVLAANAPLLQFWLSRTSHKDAKNPYFLYSASNIGSLVALFGYPFAVEPLFTLSQQTMLWSGIFLLFFALIGCCMAYLHKNHVPPAAADKVAAAGAKPGLKQKLHWILLSFCPSSLLLGVTTYITTDLASMPLFWVIPLAIYLLTFILAFARTPLMVDRALAAQVVLAPLTALVMLFDLNAVTPILLLHLLTFFVVVMGCHGTLARSKPDARHLTEYYLWISFGGMLGGVFNALVAPQIFTEPFEYSLVFILTLLLRPQLVPDSKRERLLDYIVPALFMALVIMAFRLSPADTKLDAITGYVLANNIFPMLLFMPVVFTAIKSHQRPLRFALFILALFISVPIGKSVSTNEPAAGQLLYEERNFFGVNRLFKWAPTNAMLLLHGTTLHGMQPLDKDKRLELTTYYHVMAGVSDHLAPALRDKPVAVLGLGAGTLACTGHNGQEFDFYEIDPAIADIARNRDYFTYLSDCPPHSNVILGDGRLEVAKAKDKHYGMVVVDTFSSDAIPMHILTREALAIYASKLADGGIMAFNISNRHLKLGPVMSKLAQDGGWVALIKRDSKMADDTFVSSSIWVLFARDMADFHGLEKSDKEWKPLEPADKSGIWTDNYSNIFETLF